MIRSLGFFAGLAFVLTASLHASPGGEEIPDFLEQRKPKAKIMLLGTFHFKDAGLDSYKPEHEIDILSPQRQREVQEVVDLLAKYKPTKIAVEWKPEYQAKTDEKYAQHLAGELKLTSNEIHQLGFRLGKKLGRQKVWLVDAKGRWFEDRTDIEAYAKKHGQEALLSSEWYARYTKLAAYADARKMRTTLREHLLLLNSEEAIRVNHGVYLVGSFKVGKGDDYPGVDGFVSSWYNRNLKIFANLQRIADSSGDRILLIIGAGHVPIIRHAVQASPEFDLVEVREILDP